MTNREIKRLALDRLRGKWGTCVALTVFKASFVLALIAIEAMIYVILDHLGIEYSYWPSAVFGTDLGRFMLSARILVILLLMIPEVYIMRRLLLDICVGNNFLDTRRYIQQNSRRIYAKTIAGTVVPFMLKCFAAVPLFISIYIAHYFGTARSGEQLTTAALFLFMLAIGFSIVWVGVLVHYSISLSLTKYIMTLNPRANVFDACDLSVRLMDGHHMRYLSLLFSFVKYIPLMLLIYPIFAIEPYIRVSFAMLAKDIMGSYWQDKYPAMIKRWSKYAG
ncbi:MAG: DUF975 family protein [Ruminococcus sp.]|nr:DUF975 family protein [Ruminococcus sp.]